MIFQTRILADFFVIFVDREVHAQDRVIIIGVGELRRGVRDQPLDQLGDNAARANHFLSHALRNVARNDS
jgi:hypothetical protein